MSSQIISHLTSPITSSLLALCAPTDAYKGPFVVGKLQGSIEQKKFEPAGYKYSLYEFKDKKPVGKVVEEKKKVDANEAALKKIKWHTIKDNINEDDHFALLCLPNGMASTEEEIKLRHKRLCLLYHPDKAMPEDREKTENRFKKITIAFETLTDPIRRKQYESTIPFDEWYPDDDCEDWLGEWGPTFVNNARYSVVQPVPKVGDMHTPIEDVKAFYDFWYAFKSWRDFKVEKDHNLEKADGRDERRWMEKENDKLRVPKRKEEAVRIRKMVELAERTDPRLLKHKKEEKRKRLQEKEDKENARLAKIKEAEELVRIEKEKKEAEAAEAAKVAAAAKLKKDNEKNIQKKLRSSLRKYFSCANSHNAEHFVASDEDIDFFSRNVPVDSAIELIGLFHKAMPDVLPQGPSAMLTVEVPECKEEGDLHSLTDKGMAMFHTLFRAQKSPKEIEALDIIAKKHAEKVEAEKAKLMHVKKVVAFWTRDELALLTTACVKYPVGTQGRWEIITNYIGSRSEAEVIAKAKELATLN